MKNIIKIFALVVVVVMLTLALQSAINPYIVLNNPQVKGWLFGKDNEFCGEKAWGYSGTADTITVTGITTGCLVFLTPKTDCGVLRYDIPTAGGSIIVTSSASQTATSDKYGYFIVRNAYGATD